MRQIGLLAAAAEHALENHWDLMKEDHRRAKEFAEAISEVSAFSIDLDTVETNIVLFDTLEQDANTVIAKFAELDIHFVPFGPNTIRATFHFQVGDEELASIKEILAEF